MKTTKITYWVLTGITALGSLFSSYSYLTSPQMVATFGHLGFPSYFRIELAVAKFLGIIILLVPLTRTLERLKEWVYAAFTIVFVSAFIAHSSVGDPMVMRVFPIIFLAFLVGSYISYHKIKDRNLQS
ncbi:DoxX family protein [Mucilaginibacter lappiensis]|uniref:DoxX family protein n=1 Tax=Mucilaginibacter lappiensis TaxID=354630 RepID=UPI003D1C2EF2